MSSYNREKYLKNREVVLARSKAYYFANKARLLILHRIALRKRLQNPEQRAKKRAYAKQYYSENIERCRLWYYTWKTKHPVAHKESENKMAQKNSAFLPDSYIRALLGAGREEIPQAIINAKREQVRLFREIKKQTSHDQHHRTTKRPVLHL